MPKNSNRSSVDSSQSSLDSVDPLLLRDDGTRSEVVWSDDGLERTDVDSGKKRDSNINCVDPLLLRDVFYGLRDDGLERTDVDSGKKARFLRTAR